MRSKVAFIGALCAAIALVFVQLSPADPGAQAKSEASRVKKKGPRGPRGPRGKPGPQGPSGIASIVEVEGADLVMAPGQFGGAPLARCPAGSVVVGTGFNGPFDAVGGFVKAYGTFVGGFFENDSSIVLTGNVQAICAQVGAAAAGASVSSGGRFNRDVARAERVAASS